VTILSLNNWAFSFKFLGSSRKWDFFDVMQIGDAQILLPVSGILIALFAGWVLKPETTREVLHIRPSWLFPAWLWLMRLVIPALLLFVLFNLPDLFA